MRLSAVLVDRPDGPERLIELRRLLEEHAAAGSVLAVQVLELRDLAPAFWVVEPATPAPEAPIATERTTVPVTSTAVAAAMASGNTTDPGQPVG